MRKSTSRERTDIFHNSKHLSVNNSQTVAIIVLYVTVLILLMNLVINTQKDI